jgi:hypothetical protein
MIESHCFCDKLQYIKHDTFLDFLDILALEVPEKGEEMGSKVYE